MGTITAGFFKLLIPFLCIVPGMAAGYILDDRSGHRKRHGLCRADAHAAAARLRPGGHRDGRAGGRHSLDDRLDDELHRHAVHVRHLSQVRASRGLGNAADLGGPRGDDGHGVRWRSGCRSYFGQTRGGIFNTMADYNAYLVPGVIVAFIAGILQPFVTRTASFVCILAGTAVVGRCSSSARRWAVRSPVAGVSSRGPGHRWRATCVLLVVSLLTQPRAQHRARTFHLGSLQARTPGRRNRTGALVAERQAVGRVARGLHAVDVLVLCLRTGAGRHGLLTTQDRFVRRAPRGDNRRRAAPAAGAAVTWAPGWRRSACPGATGRLDLADFFQLLDDAVDHLAAFFDVGQFAAAEDDRHDHLVLVLQEACAPDSP